MSYYKIEVSNSAGWHNHKVVTLGVSVPSCNWEGDKFEAILDFAAANFEFICIDVTDALYRHNFIAEGAKPEQALAQANSLGALWLAQHQEAIDACFVKPKIIRWAEWYSHEDYQETLAGFQRAYKLSPALYDAVHNDAMGFYHRRHAVPSPVELECAKNFLIEEMSIVSLQARTLPGLRIYPGEELSCLNIVRHGLISDAPKGLEKEQFAKIKFIRRRDRAPLQAQNDSALGERRSAAIRL
jgi:tRNA-dependent cyclodipeptide synthase